jgi:hypothetical protein
MPTTQTTSPNIMSDAQRALRPRVITPVTSSTAVVTVAANAAQPALGRIRSSGVVSRPTVAASSSLR